MRQELQSMHLFHVILLAPNCHVPRVTWLTSTSSLAGDNGQGDLKPRSETEYDAPYSLLRTPYSLLPILPHFDVTTQVGVGTVVCYNALLIARQSSSH